VVKAKVVARPARRTACPSSSGGSASDFEGWEEALRNSNGVAMKGAEEEPKRNVLGLHVHFVPLLTAIGVTRPAQASSAPGEFMKKGTCQEGVLTSRFEKLIEKNLELSSALNSKTDELRQHRMMCKQLIRASERTANEVTDPQVRCSIMRHSETRA
jgi:hypothetical protein